MVVDGRPGEAFDSVSWPPAMSDDGEVVACSARRGGEQYCVVSGRKGPAYRRVGHPVVSADGRHVAYGAEDATGAFVVVDGRQGPRFRWVGNVVLSRDGRHVAYCAETAGDDGVYRSFVVVDDRPGAAFERVARPAFNGDGRVVAYGARRRGQWFVVAGEREIPSDGEIASVFVGPDGGRLGWVLEEERAYVVMTEGSRGPRFDWIGWPTFAPDGRAIYFAARGRTRFVVAGDREIELGDWVVWDPALSADGHRLAFGARVGRELWRKVLTFW